MIKCVLKIIDFLFEKIVYTISPSILEFLRVIMKRKHGVEKYPEVSEAILSHRFTTREPADKKKYSQELTWTVFRLVYDENDKILQDYYFCSRCHEIYHLNLSTSGECLKRHAAKCVQPATTSKITDFLVPEFEAAKRRKIKPEDRKLVRDASIEFVVKDMRPISSINGEGMASLMSKMTHIGAKYGHITADTISSILPSRQSVRYVKIIRQLVCIHVFLILKF